MLGRATHGSKRLQLLHDMMEGRDYGQSKDLISDRSVRMHIRYLLETAEDLRRRDVECRPDHTFTFTFTFTFGAGAVKLPSAEAVLTIPHFSSSFCFN